MHTSRFVLLQSRAATTRCSSSTALPLLRGVAARAYGGWAIETRGGGTAGGEDEVRVVRMASNPVNCINPVFFDQLNATLERLERDNASSHPSPVVFSSASEKTFSAGLDLKTVSAMSRDELASFTDRLNESYVRLLTLNCPTVAAVNGHAIAGGALLALSADYRVASSPGKSWFGVNEVRLGLPFPSGPWAVMRHVAATRPLLHQLILSGELVSLEAAHQLYGLVDHMLPPGSDLVEGSVGYARKAVARHSLRAFVAVKHTMQEPVVERYERERRAGDIDRTFVDIFFAEDTRRAIKQRLDGLKA